jgi:ssDNA-binding Zn-finger/Zn-ribbon topoisomerase 1
MENDNQQPEKQAKVCKVCNQLKVRILKGKFNKKDKKWKSAEGGYWNGHVCPECHRIRCAERQRLKRASSK